MAVWTDGPSYGLILGFLVSRSKNVSSTKDNPDPVSIKTSILLFSMLHLVTTADVVVVAIDIAPMWVVVRGLLISPGLPHPLT